MSTSRITSAMKSKKNKNELTFENKRGFRRLGTEDFFYDTEKDKWWCTFDLSSNRLCKKLQKLSKSLNSGVKKDNTLMGNCFGYNVEKKLIYMFDTVNTVCSDSGKRKEDLERILFKSCKNRVYENEFPTKKRYIRHKESQKNKTNEAVFFDKKNFYWYPVPLNRNRVRKLIKKINKEFSQFLKQPLVKMFFSVTVTVNSNDRSKIDNNLINQKDEVVILYTKKLETELEQVKCFFSEKKNNTIVEKSCPWSGCLDSNLRRVTTRAINKRSLVNNQSESGEEFSSTMQLEEDSALVEETFIEGLSLFAYATRTREWENARENAKKRERTKESVASFSPAPSSDSD